MQTDDSTRRSYCVYTLSGSISNRVFYVGMARTTYRLNEHLAEAQKECACKKCQTIRDLLSAGQELTLTVVYRTNDEADAFDREIELIAIFGRARLTNRTDGGKGGLGHTVSPETRRKIGDSHRRPVECACLACGKPFISTPSKVAARHALYCSNACRGKGISGPNSPTWKGGKRAVACKSCGETMLINPGQNRQYCSVACRGIGRRTGMFKTCEVCGQEFWVKPYNGWLRCCSNACSGVWKRGKPKQRLRPDLPAAAAP